LPTSKVLNLGEREPSPVRRLRAVDGPETLTRRPPRLLVRPNKTGRQKYPDHSIPISLSATAEATPFPNKNSDKLLQSMVCIQRK